MVDITTISTGISSIKTAWDIAKDLNSIDSSIQNAELKYKLAELIDALSEAKISMSEMRDANHALKVQVTELEKQLKQADKSIVRIGDVLYKTNPSGIPVGKACCQPCYDNHTLFVNFAQKNGTFSCTKCAAHIHPSYVLNEMTPSTFASLKERNPESISYE